VEGLTLPSLAKLAKLSRKDLVSLASACSEQVGSKESATGLARRLRDLYPTLQRAGAVPEEHLSQEEVESPQEVAARVDAAGQTPFRPEPESSPLPQREECLGAAPAQDQQPHPEPDDASVPPDPRLNPARRTRSPIRKERVEQSPPSKESGCGGSARSKRAPRSARRERARSEEESSRHRHREKGFPLQGESSEYEPYGLDESSVPELISSSSELSDDESEESSAQDSPSGRRQYTRRGAAPRTKSSERRTPKHKDRGDKRVTWVPTLATPRLHATTTPQTLPPPPPRTVRSPRAGKEKAQLQRASPLMSRSSLSMTQRIGVAGLDSRPGTRSWRILPPASCITSTPSSGPSAASLTPPAPAPLSPPSSPSSNEQSERSALSSPKQASRLSVTDSLASISSATASMSSSVRLASTFDRLRLRSRSATAEERPTTPPTSRQPLRECSEPSSPMLSEFSPVSWNAQPGAFPLQHQPPLLRVPSFGSVPALPSPPLQLPPWAGTDILSRLSTVGFSPSTASSSQPQLSDPLQWFPSPSPELVLHLELPLSSVRSAISFLPGARSLGPTFHTPWTAPATYAIPASPMDMWPGPVLAQRRLF